MFCDGPNSSHIAMYDLPFIKELARISFAYHTPILLTSVIVAFAFAILLLSSKEAKKIAGRWVTYAGWAFLAYGFQYVFRLVGWLLKDFEGDGYFYLKVALNFLANLGSGVNNLFFLAAAAVLLNKRTPFLKRGIFTAIVMTTATLTTAANFYFKSPWASASGRLPDSLISAFCLGLFGYAMMINFFTHQHRFWAISSLIIALLYGSIQLVYAVNPVRAQLEQNSIQQILIQEEYTLGPDAEVDFLDNALFTVALPMKMLIFLPPFYLFFTLVIAAHDFRKVLHVVTEQKKPYLSSDGIVAAIGTSISATVVEVFIKLPGTAPKAAWRIAWPRSENLASFILLDSQHRVDRRLLNALNGQSEIPLQQSGDKMQKIHTSSPPINDVPSVALPIKFHGAAIGCLKAEFRKPRNFNYAALQQLVSMADLLAPAVQDYRALASIDQLSERFARLQVQKPGAEFHQTTEEMGKILYDVLSPLAVGLLLEVGFQSKRVREGTGESRRLLDEQTVDHEGKDSTTYVEKKEVFPVKVYKSPLVATDRHDPFRTLLLGNLVLILPSKHDKINHPTLGDYSLHRRAITSQAADGFLDLTREHLSFELKKLSVALNAEALTQESWLTSIQELCRKVELLWVSVTKTDDTRTLGDPAGEQIIPNLTDEQRKTLEAQPLSSVPYKDESTKTHHVMRIDLEKSRHQLWFGVEREGFGVELEFPSPWKTFLEDFSEITDSALASLFEVQKSKETLAKLAEDKTFVYMGITSKYVMHELTNKVDAQQLSAESIWKTVERGGISLDANQRAQMKAIHNSATVMKELMAILNKATKPDERGVFALREVVTKAAEFYEYLNVHDIKIRNRVKEDLWIKMPFNAARFAIANLIGNSKDAIEERIKEREPDYTGEIRIEAKSESDSVICYVIDNGPGIPQEILDRLYQLGSTKDGHHGEGLYLTHRSLSENGGEIKLLEFCRGGTKFSIKFPRAQNPQL